MARRHRSTFQRGPRRATDWSASVSLAGAVNVAASTAAILEVFIPIIGGETLIRTRGMFTVGSDQSSGDEIQIGAFGICVVTEQAATVGITAVPHPSSDAAWGGWVVHQYYAARTEFLSAVGFQPNTWHRFPIDSKGMRKIDEDERLIVVVENASAFGITVTSQERFLTKVH